MNKFSFFVIEITSDVVDEQTGVRDGQAFHTRRQTAYVHVGKDFPAPIVVRLEPGQPAYPKDLYFPTGDTFSLGDFGSFKAGRLRGLVPVREALKQVQGALGSTPAPSSATSPAMPAMGGTTKAA